MCRLARIQFISVRIRGQRVAPHSRRSVEAFKALAAAEGRALFAQHKANSPASKKVFVNHVAKRHAELAIHIMSPETVLSMRKTIRLCGCDCPLCSDAQQEGPSQKRFAYSHNNNNRKHRVLAKSDLRKYTTRNHQLHDRNLV